MAKLGDICKFQSGGTPSKANESFFGGSIPWITTVSLNDSVINEENAVDWITESAIKQSAAKIVPKNSVMIGTRVGVGKTAINSVEMSTSQDVISLLDIDEDKWDKHFLCLFFVSKRDYLLSQARGATIKGIKIDTLSSLDLPEYSLETQKQIAAALDKATQTIDLCNAILEKLDLLVKARFVEMFGDCLDRKPLSYYSELITKGASPKWQGIDYCDDGTLFVTSENVREGYVDLSKRKYLPNTINDLLPRSVLRKNDVLVNIVGASIGRAAIFDKDELANINQAVSLVRIKENSLNLQFLIIYLNSEEAQKAYGFMKKGGARDNLSLKNISDLLIPDAPLQNQNQFAAYVEKNDRTKAAVKQVLAKAETLKKALMQEYFG